MSSIFLCIKAPLYSSGCWGTRGPMYSLAISVSKHPLCSAGTEGGSMLAYNDVLLWLFCSGVCGEKAEVLDWKGMEKAYVRG